MVAFVSLYCQLVNLSLGGTKDQINFSSFDWIFIYLTGYILLSQLGPLPHILPLHQKCSTNGTMI